MAADVDGTPTNARKPWTITALYGQFSDQNSIGDMMRFTARIKSDYQFAGAALTRKIYSFGRHLDLEGEGQIIKHIHGQNHWEFNFLGALRWRTFPWDRWLDTSMAVGLGLSYASEKPRVEQVERDTQRLLAYILVEAEVGMPQLPDWKLAARIHHRSGAFGVLQDSRNGNKPGRSNALAIGVKYLFD